MILSLFDLNAMYRSYYSLLLSILLLSCQSNTPTVPIELPPTAFEQSQGLETETYESGIAYWQLLDEHYDEIKLIEAGTTDSGQPLHLAIISPSKIFDPKKLQEQGKTVLLINNAIHPGEADGVDASLWLCKDLLTSGSLEGQMGEVVLAVIPFYNVGGTLNRNSTTRANQQGPKSYGFRGNAQNYDLNRDFIKADTKNARSFAKLFTAWNPAVMVDTHVSNGANYQHVLTYLATQSQKLGPILGKYMDEKLSPALFAHLDSSGFPMTPYVNVWGTTPDEGWNQFIDHPRYSTGYGALHHTLGMMTETHMLKPFKQRVEATHAFLEGLLAYTKANAAEIQQVRNQAIAASMKAKSWPIQWEIDKSQWTDFMFKGFEGAYIPSEVTGLQRLKYDESKPYEKNIKWYNHYQASLAVEKPKAYIIPQAWAGVIERLQDNGVQLRAFEQDTSLTVGAYHIQDFNTTEMPYEGHYAHSNTQVIKKPAELTFRKGDYWIDLQQPKARFIVEVLEPQAVDSYFTWNFFDIVLQRKEGFSPYVFEERALELLASNDSLRQAFDAKKQAMPDFANNPYGQLKFLYEHSPHAEESYRRYPIFRVER